MNVPPTITFEGPEAAGVGARVVLVAKSEDRDGGPIRTRTWEQTAGPELQLSGFEGESIEFDAPRVTETADVTLQHCVVDDEQDTFCRELTLTVLSALDLGLRGGIQTLLDLSDPTTGLPRDEATDRELRNGRFNSEDWTPQHAAMLITAMVIGHALNEEAPEVFETLELDDEGLLRRFDLLLDSLERITGDRSRHFRARDFLAFYHIYQGRLAQTDSLGRFVLFEDNAMLYTALTLAANYLQPIDAETAERVSDVRARLDLSLWKAPDGGISVGTTDLPVAEGRIDRFNSQSRLPVVAARASSALSETEFNAVLADLIAQSATDPAIRVLPPIGKMVEVYGAVPWLGERDTAIRSVLLEPLYAAHASAAHRLGVPISHTSVPVVQRRTVEYALAPFEGVDELLEEFQDLAVITPPGAAMVTAIGTEASLVNYEEVVLIIQNEIGIDPRYGPSSVFDFGVTGTVPEDVAPMYGALETGYAVVALASNRLDRDFVMDLLRLDLGWDRAIREYRDAVAVLLAP